MKKYRLKIEIELTEKALESEMKFLECSTIEDFKREVEKGMHRNCIMPEETRIESVLLYEVSE